MRRWVVAAIMVLCSACLVSASPRLAGAQGPPSGFDVPGAAGLTPDLIRTLDIQKALLWTGHYTAVVDGDFGRITRTAVAAWQQSRGWQATGELRPHEAMALVTEGARIRDEWRWTIYRNDEVGYSIGYVARTFQTTRRLARGGAEFTSADGTTSLSVLVGTWGEVGSFEALYEHLAASSGERMVDYKVRTPTWFVVSGTKGYRAFYMRAERRASGVAMFVMSVPRDRRQQLGHFVTATANSFHVDYDIRPSVSPPDSQSPSPPTERGPPSPSPSALADRTGRTSAIQFRLSGQDPELRASQVFERVSGAVYVVAALSTSASSRDPDINQGSAVAISRQELLTNCHVVRGAHAVVLLREGQMMRADVASGDTRTDRCVLRAEHPLPTFVRVRPYADIKTGEPVYAIGAPHSLELTLSQGLVSSKRTLDGVRYVQTDAPISPGSSGGGLFDAAGNLLGITTFSRRNSQNLNFAIAAEEYAK